MDRGGGGLGEADFGGAGLEGGEAGGFRGYFVAGRGRQRDKGVDVEGGAGELPGGLPVAVDEEGALGGAIPRGQRDGAVVSGGAVVGDSPF